ncbi:GNAT family N-acetyltransferase [Sulfuriroseicoccus oceanibius]|uniref:GNAT family N-acetyltransferase n=1 Tax=Sulfuriroseicoccus oceanibius TaxID=2707525 RepID=A0A6B3L3S1_9BACT|nr:GNAT family N-acetyltransferase [Sulfuriroseicoccus oceanibius]QQL46137.1 GNAT family N-acetyltransferase [Sulfuriroseicoccus oceanibius]
MATSSAKAEEAIITAATLDDLPELVDLLVDLFELEADFDPNPAAQRKGLRLLIENPSRGRVFVVRHQGRVVGMANVLFTVSTALGGFALVLEDLVIAPHERGHGFGHKLLNYVIDFSRKKEVSRITLLTDRISVESQKFFQEFGFTYSEMVPMRLLL